MFRSVAVAASKRITSNIRPHALVSSVQSVGVRRGFITDNKTEAAKKEYHEQMEKYRTKNAIVGLALLGFGISVYYYSIWAVEKGKDTFTPEEMKEIEKEIDEELRQQSALSKGLH